MLQLKKDKVELENQLEQEQEALVNRLWKRMDKLEAEKWFNFTAILHACHFSGHCTHEPGLAGCCLLGS